MNALKQILKWTLICLLAFTSFNFFISGKIETSIEIEVPAYVVYGEVTNLETWPTWAAWWKKDTTMTTEYSDVKNGLGAKMSWVGLDGSGSLEIVETTFAQSIKNELLFDEMPPSYGIWKFESTENGTKVTWGFQDEMPFFLHFMQLFITPDLEEGLQGLKAKCESMPSRSSEVAIVDVPEQHYLYIETTCAMNEIGETLGATYGELFAYIGQNALSPVSMPFARWNSFPKQAGDEDVVVFDAGVLIASNHLGNGRVEGGLLKLRKTIQATHYGAYELSGNTHDLIDVYAAENGLEVIPGALEFYTNDPTTVAPEDVETLIIYDLVE